MKQEVIDALQAHAQWRNKLSDAIEKGTSEFKVDVVKVDNACAFGKWLYGLSDADKNTAEFKNVIELHANFHKIAAETLDLAVKGNKEAAKKSMDIGGDYNRASSRLVLALNKWKN